MHKDYEFNQSASGEKVVVPTVKASLRHKERRPRVDVIADGADFESKRWPVMEELDDETLTNALGFPMFKKTAPAEKPQAEPEPQSTAEAEILPDEAEEPEIPMITVEELEKITNDAYERAYAEGREQGLKEGTEKGYGEGWEQGLEEGRKQGYEEGHAEGLKTGYDEGFKRGNSEGLKNGSEVVKSQSERFRTLADKLARPLDEVSDEVLSEMVYLITRLARIFIKRDFEHDREGLKKTLEMAVSELPLKGKGAEISLNPDDLAVVNSVIGQDYIRSRGWILSEKPELKPGDVEVQLGPSLVSLSLDERIDNTLREFLNSVYARDADGEQDDGRSAGKA